MIRNENGGADPMEELLRRLEEENNLRVLRLSLIHL